MDDQLQRGGKGKRRRYFLAAALRREQDASLRRLHAHALRPPEAAQRGPASKSRLSLPVPIYIPLAEVHERPGTVTCSMHGTETGTDNCCGSWRA